MPRTACSQPPGALMTVRGHQIGLRDTVPADDTFLRALHTDIHPELATLDRPSAAIVQLLDLQITAQTHYHAAYPDARDQLICVADHPVGRCWTHQSATELRLLELAVLSTRRRRGIGRAVMSELCRRAEIAGLPLRLHVWHANASAQRLYARVGFRCRGQAAGYLAKEWTASGPATPVVRTILNPTDDERGHHG